MSEGVYITKNDGRRELFSAEKLAASLHRSGAGEKTISAILEHIQGELKDGISTSAIYHHAFFLLHKIERPVALQYSIKKAVMELGPSGFPFESFVAEIFKDRGFSVKTDQIVQGFCVDHEVDVVAWNENKLIMVEAKFHNGFDLKSDIKIALYVKARFDDLKKASFLIENKKRTLDEGWLVTNTKFSETAIKYGECQNFKMVGWNYPHRGSLLHMIEDGDIHPITCLSTLSKMEKEILLKQGIVLCKKIAADPNILSLINAEGEKRQSILDEIQLL
ncbi:MAG: restriction endonuclease [Candidatus Paceibacterota bacterium]|jgi:hypothetical protein